MKHLKRFIFNTSPILILVLLFCKSPEVQCQTFYGPITESMGRSGRASLHALDAHYLNPAVIPYTQEYNAGVVYQSIKPDLSTPSNTYGVVITDNSLDKLFSAGGGYLKTRTSYPDHTTIDQDLSVSASTLVAPTISIGAQFRRWIHSPNIGREFTKHNLSVGALFKPKPFFGIAVVGYDILNDDDLDMVPTIAVGAEVTIMEMLELCLDISRPEKKNPDKFKGTLALGLQIDGGSGFFLRTGGTWDTVLNKTYWSGGIGWEGPRLSLAYGYRTNVNENDDVVHSLNAWIQF